MNRVAEFLLPPTPQTWCPLCEEQRRDVDIEADGACAFCHIEIDATAAARRAEVTDEEIDAMALAWAAEATSRAVDHRHGRLIAPPALPHACACGRPAVALRGDHAFCGTHLHLAFEVA